MQIMDVTHMGLLVVAGVAAGAVNAIAGGGSLITFPTLIATGLPPVDANVTNSVSVFPGYVSSVLGSRADLAGQGGRAERISRRARWARSAAVRCCCSRRRGRSR